MFALAIFGALIVFPMAGIARDNFGKGAGVIAAWLIAFMPTHVQKSTWAMADHDAFVLLFLTAAFMYYLRAIKAGGDERLSRYTNAYPSGIVSAISQVLREKKSICQCYCCWCVLWNCSFGMERVSFTDQQLSSLHTLYR